MIQPAAQPEGSLRQLQILEAPGQNSVGIPMLDSFLGGLQSITGTAVQLEQDWGEIRDLGQGGDQQPPPQPTERNMSGADDEAAKVGLFGISTAGLLAAAAVGALIYFAGGNWAWVLIGAAAAAILAAYFMG